MAMAVLWDDTHFKIREAHFVSRQRGSQQIANINVDHVDYNKFFPTFTQNSKQQSTKMATKRAMLVVAIVTASSMPICNGFLQTKTPHPHAEKLTFLATTSSSDRPVTSLHATKFDQEVNAMFQRYDADGNGQIDKEEFRAVVEKMKSSSRRREVISVAAASFGSLVSHSILFVAQFEKRPNERNQYSF